MLQPSPASDPRTIATSGNTNGTTRSVRTSCAITTCRRRRRSNMLLLACHVENDGHRECEYEEDDRQRRAVPDLPECHAHAVDLGPQELGRVRRSALRDQERDV